jgi:hypothetical protein
LSGFRSGGRILGSLDAAGRAGDRPLELLGDDADVAERQLVGGIVDMKTLEGEGLFVAFQQIFTVRRRFKITSSLVLFHVNFDDNWHSFC